MDITELILTWFNGIDMFKKLLEIVESQPDTYKGDLYRVQFEKEDNLAVGNLLQSPIKVWTFNKDSYLENQIKWRSECIEPEQVIIILHLSQATGFDVDNFLSQNMENLQHTIDLTPYTNEHEFLVNGTLQIDSIKDFTHPTLKNIKFYLVECHTI